MIVTITEHSRAYTFLVHVYVRSESIADIISCIINSFSILVKARPSLGNVIIGALTNWAPNSISFLNSTQIRSVEKTLRLALIHLLRSGQVNAFAAQINDCLHRQEQRMRLAAEADRRKKEEEASLKRQRISDEAYGGGYGTPDYAATKRIRLQESAGIGATGTPPPSSSAAVTQSGLADFDIKMLKPELVLELIIANLQVMTPERVQAAVEVSAFRLPFLFVIAVTLTPFALHHSLLASTWRTRQTL